MCLCSNEGKPARRRWTAMANNTSTTMWSVKSVGLADERGNFCGNSRLVRKLTHTIYGSYLQIAALEQKTHATGRRINWARRECPYSSICTNMWTFCKLERKGFHPIGWATIKLANRWESLLFAQLFLGPNFSREQKGKLACVERAVEQF